MGLGAGMGDTCHLATSGVLICLETALPELRTPSRGSLRVCQVLTPLPLQGSSSWRPPTCRNIPEFRSGLGPGAWVGKSPELEIHPPCDPGSQSWLAQLSLPDTPRAELLLLSPTWWVALGSSAKRREESSLDGTVLLNPWKDAGSGRSGGHSTSIPARGPT